MSVFQLVVQRPYANAEFRGGLSLIATMATQCLVDCLNLDFAKRHRPASHCGSDEETTMRFLLAGAFVGLVVGVLAGACLAELPRIASWIQSHGIHGGNLGAWLSLLFWSGVIGTLTGTISGAVMSSRLRRK